MSLLLPSIESPQEFQKIRSKTELWTLAAQKIVKMHGLPPCELKLYPDGTNIVFAHGLERVIKIFPPIHASIFESERLVLRHLSGKLSVKTPNLMCTGEIEGWPYMIMERLEGQILEGLWEKLTVENKRTLIEELGKLIKEVHSLGVSGLESIDCHWNQFIERQLNQCVERHRRNGISESLIEELPRYLRDAAGLIPRSIKPVLLTGEYTPMNLLVREGSDGWHIEGLIDFGDCMLGFHEYDLLGLEPFLFKAIMPF